MARQERRARARDIAQSFYKWLMENIKPGNVVGIQTSETAFVAHLREAVRAPVEEVAPEQKAKRQTIRSVVQ